MKFFFQNNENKIKTNLEIKLINKQINEKKVRRKETNKQTNTKKVEYIDREIGR
jgi:hypothetical protein